MLQSIKFLRKKSRGEVEGDTKPTPLAPVILGLVLRIFWQQGTNLVNKLALLNKCLLREDSWDKPKNDGCWGRMRNFCSTFFKYPSPDAEASSSPSCGEESRLLRCARNDVASNGDGLHRPWCNKILGTWPSMTGARGANYFGRSMIEMLGVLAIIAVLTVGGIAGYSKAMKKYQANKVVGEIIQVLANIKELSENDNLFDIDNLDEETKKTLGLCLPSAENCSGYQRTPVGEIEIDGGVFMRDADAELCISAFNNIVIPLKGNTGKFYVRNTIKNRDDTLKEKNECMKECRDKYKNDRERLYKCLIKCSDDNNPYAGICISEDKENCSDGKYLNLYDARVVTEINAACNSGIDKKADHVLILFKKGLL